MPLVLPPGSSRAGDVAVLGMRAWWPDRTCFLQGLSSVTNEGDAHVRIVFSYDGLVQLLGQLLKTLDSCPHRLEVTVGFTGRAERLCQGVGVPEGSIPLWPPSGVSMQAHGGREPVVVPLPRI